MIRIKSSAESAGAFRSLVSDGRGLAVPVRLPSRVAGSEVFYPLVADCDNLAEHGVFQRFACGIESTRGEVADIREALVNTLLRRKLFPKKAAEVILAEAGSGKLIAEIGTDLENPP